MNKSFAAVNARQSYRAARGALARARLFVTYAAGLADGDKAGPIVLEQACGLLVQAAFHRANARDFRKIARCPCEEHAP